MKATDRIFVTISPQMYLWQVKTHWIM